MNGAWADLLRMGHGRIYCVTPEVACAASRARSFEEVAAPCSVHARKLEVRTACGRGRVRGNATKTRPRPQAVLTWLCALLACLTLAACNSSPVEETVTLDASRLSALPAQAVAATPQLPARDEDIEAAGDRIAEAITSLSKRRGSTSARPTTAAAQRALDGAEAALTRALRDKPHDEPVREALRAALRELNTAERTIQRGNYTDAIRDLTALDKKLDTLHGAEDSKL